jgi:hypothetical protein
MKVEPVAWRVDSSKTHHFTLYDAKQVPLWEARAGSDKEVTITPMYPAIPPGYSLVPDEPPASIPTSYSDCRNEDLADALFTMCRNDDYHGLYVLLVNTAAAKGE